MPSPVGNASIAAVIRSPFYQLRGDSFGLITITGRKTGWRISTPINVARREDGYTVVSYRTRTWWKNLRGGRTGELHLAGKTIPITARILESASEVKSGPRDYFERYPAYVQYFSLSSDAG